MVIKAGTLPVGMSERRVDDMRVGNSVGQLLGADLDQPMLLALNAIIGCPVKQDDVGKHSVTVDDIC
jgi:hypothetical protein